uniref:Uncharacterized protein n=1 Tax=viral metagenome TaxID=1070528 RepID=A0A6C0CQA0_9ZZZZ
MQAHPSQYQTPIYQDTPVTHYSAKIASPSPATQYTFQNKIPVIHSAIYLTILFVVLSNTQVHTFLNNFYGMWTSQPNGLLDELGFPTFKGTILFGGLFFISTLWIIKK